MDITDCNAQLSMAWSYNAIGLSGSGTADDSMTVSVHAPLFLLMVVVSCAVYYY